MKHDLKIEFSGTVLFLEVELENIPVILKPDGKSKFTRELEDFEISGELDVFIRCKGFNTTKWNCTLSLDGNELKKYKGEIKKGESKVNDSIKVD